MRSELFVRQQLVRGHESINAPTQVMANLSNCVKDAQFLSKLNSSCKLRLSVDAKGGVHCVVVLCDHTCHCEARC